MSETDLQLLHRYARSQAEDAFAEIVRRHLNLVFSAALRSVRSPQLAEEVAQSVFTDLARSAAGLAAGTNLPAWLYTVTRRTAIDVVRHESRRQLREKIACEFNAMNATAADWTRIEPLLDEAMEALDEADRTAILLRYFKNQSLREVGQALGTTEDAAQKRVSRAVERLREFFTHRGLTVGAGGLMAVISANAIQAAPVGLALTITATALAGVVGSTTTVIAATQTVAMFGLQKAVVAVTLAVVAGAGIYEACQVATLRSQAESLRQQQGPLTEQLRQWQSEEVDATQRLTALAEEKAQLNTGRTAAELLRLRGEVARLQAAQGQTQSDPLQTVAILWLNRVRQLKDYLEQHPDDKIPEFEFLTEAGWLSAVDPGMDFPGQSQDEFYDHALQFLRIKAESELGRFIQVALGQYADANSGGFPTDLSQLQSYCEPKVEVVLQALYEIKPAGILPADQVKEMNLKTDWVVVRKKRIISNSTSRTAFFANGSASWQSPPGPDGD